MKTPKIKTFISALVLSLLCQPLCLASFSGSLASDYSGANITGADGALTGIAGPNLWINSTSPSTLSWTVTQNGSLWNYQYTLSVPTKGISHVLIETSDNFTADDLLDPIALAGSFTGTFINVWDSNSTSNVGMPENLYGIKFDDVSSGGEVLLLTVDFNSPKSPVWGDFYAVDGKKPGEENALWNLGFSDADPLVAPSDGSVNHHLLVPDTTTTIIPAPSAILLTAIGVGTINRLRKRLK